ncbi:MAG: 50S ribosomal protein L33 [Alphaproteobacteria bacterium]|nr:50S ribosomal protein L33 [Alphaproteobacteria bacterium]
MAKTKTAIKMESTEGTGIFYVTKKNPRNPKKLELKKYDRKLRKHVKFKEGKLK